MTPIEKTAVQVKLDSFLNKEVYLHLETTTGVYAAHRGERTASVSAYIRNGRVLLRLGSIAGEGPYRVGLKMEDGWIYADGLTDFEIDSEDRLLLAGHDELGRLTVSLELGFQPFEL